MTLSSLRGQYVIVDFWASWCKPCRAGMPAMKDLYKKYHAKGLEIIGVSDDTNHDAWKQAVAQDQTPWIHVVDEFPEENKPSRVGRLYGVHYIPSYFTKWLTATVAVNGIYGNQRAKGYTYNGFDSPWRAPAYESLYNSDGSAKLLYTWYNGNPYRDNTEGGYFKETGINLVDEYYNNVVNTKRQYMRYHGDLLFKIVNGLTANAQFVYETDHRTADWYATQESQAAKTIYNAIAVSATTVRVPVRGGHSESVNLEFEKPYDLEDVRHILETTPGVVVQDDPAHNRYPMPLYAEGRDEVFVGRIRRDFSVPSGLNFWCVADNLRKGAATNAVQIAEELLRRGFL